MSSSGVEISGLSSKRQAGTRQARGIQPEVPLENVPVRCDSDSTVRAASTCQRRVLVHSTPDRTVSVSRGGTLVSRSTDKVASSSRKWAWVYRMRISARQSLTSRRIKWCLWLLKGQWYLLMKCDFFSPAVMLWVKIINIDTSIYEINKIKTLMLFIKVIHFCLFVIFYLGLNWSCVVYQLYQKQCFKVSFWNIVSYRLLDVSVKTE